MTVLCYTYEDDTTEIRVFRRKRHENSKNVYDGAQKGTAQKIF